MRERDTDPKRLDAPRQLECRANPPTVFPAMATSALGGAQLGAFTPGWPAVKPGDWCGQFVARAAELAQA